MAAKDDNTEAYVDRAAEIAGLAIAAGDRPAVVANFRILLELIEAVRGDGAKPPDDPLSLFRP